MKPFCLEKALAGAKVCTRDGREVSEIHYFKTVDTKFRPVMAVIDGEIKQFGVDGTNLFYQDNLFLAPTKKTYWVNVYRFDYHVSEYVYQPKGLFLTKEDALKDSDKDFYFGTFPIEIED